MPRCVFPFAAVVGQERVKKALVLNSINPRIGGVLISGDKGTAKSTLVRGLADIVDMEVIDLPLNITEDRLVGGIDIEAAIARGESGFEPGLLHKADGNILYIDEVNLLSEHIANCLLEAAASGENVVEREGVSYRHKARFILIGTMNPEEGSLRPQLVDRFGLYTEVHGEPDPQKRAQIIRRRLDFEHDYSSCRARWLRESTALAQEIAEARTSLKQVSVSEDALRLAAAVAREGHCAGHRAEIVTIETARAIAALDGRDAVTEGDIQEAAGYALPHRLRQAVAPAAEIRDSTELCREDHPEVSPMDAGGDVFGGGNAPGADADNPKPQDDPACSGNDRTEREAVGQPEGAFDARLPDNPYDDVRRPRGSGKRTRVESGSRQGRYVRYRLPKGPIRDLAFDATLRAAAPFQNARREPGIAVVIRPSDIREKVRERHTGFVVLFLVDASGSMGARRRMGAVKGAILSLLGDAYRKRDRVGLVAFRRSSATTLLGITRSVDLAHKCLRDLPTGGRTPLAAGLYHAHEVLRSAMIKESEISPYLVLVSDGRANVSMTGGSAIADAFSMAARLKLAGVHSLVIDTEEGHTRLGLAQKIAEVLGADYVRLNKLTSQSITSNVRQRVT